MNIAAGSGDVTIRAALSEGHVRSAQIVSTRPVVAARLFVGRPAEEAPVLAGRLFSLCGYSHTVAARLAVAAAKNDADVDDRDFPSGLLAERIGDILRSLVVGWPEGEIAGVSTPAEIGFVRETLAACRDLTGGDKAGMAVGRVLDGLKALEVGRTDRLLSRSLALVPSGQAFLSVPPDPLTEDDDKSVILGLEFQKEAFAQMPHLSGRCAETGAFSRCHALVSSHGSGLSARMEARIRDLEQAALALADGVDGLFALGSLKAGQGYGVAESPRGRLYHWAKLDNDGVIADYGIVAPTEWNFHPAGPFVANLLGAKVGEAAGAHRLIAFLAAMFDPCVPFRVVLTEDGHA